MTVISQEAFSPATQVAPTLWGMFCRDPQPTSGVSHQGVQPGPGPHTLPHPRPAWDTELPHTSWPYLLFSFLTFFKLEKKGAHF